MLAAVFALALVASCGEGGGEPPRVAETAAEAGPPDSGGDQGAAGTEAGTEAQMGAGGAQDAAAQAGEAQRPTAPADQEAAGDEADGGEAGGGEVDGEEAASAALAATNLAALPPPKHDPEELMGLNRGQITVMLGAPNLVRRDAPAEVWQYLGGECVLDLFLYRRIPDPPTGPILPKPKPRPEERRRRANPATNPGAGGADVLYLVSYYEMRPRGPGPVSDWGCLNDLMAARHDGEAG